MAVKVNSGGIEVARVLGIDDQEHLDAITLTSANPFEEQVSFRFSLAKPEIVQFTVINAVGQVVFVSEQAYTAGRHELVWDGKDKDQRNVKSGIYFGQFSTQQGVQVFKLIKK